MSLPTRGSNASVDDGVANFRARQRQYLKKVIQDKWQCDQPGHGICIITDDKQHWTLSDRHIEEWVNLLVEGKGTTAEPPPGTFEDINHGLVRNRRTGKMAIKVVPISPARRYPRTEDSTMRRGGSDRTGRQRSVSMTEETSSQTAVRPGSLFTKVLRWIAQRGLDVIEQAAATRQGRKHIKCFKTWQSRGSFQVGPVEIRQVYDMLEDALCMAMPCYKRSTNMIAYEIGREAQNWLNNMPDLPQTHDNILLLLCVNVCLIPLILVRTSDNEPFAGDLAWELIQSLTRTPLFLREDTTTIAINVVAEELAYSKCARQHPWLGVHLLSIVETVLKIRPLSESELTAINELALRREAQAQVDRANDGQSWEVALFAYCSHQAPQFKEAVLGSTGLPYLIDTLEVNLADSILTGNIPWEDIIVTLRSLSILTQHEWVIDSDVINERAFLAIMGIFRRDIPERRLPLQYWATDILRNIIACRPTLVPALVDADILTVLSRIIPSFPTLEKGNASLPPYSTLSPALALPDIAHRRLSSDMRESHESKSSFHVRRISRSPFTPDKITQAQGMRLDIYRRAARMRAEELDRYIREYITITNPDTLPRLDLVRGEGDIWMLTL